MKNPHKHHIIPKYRCKELGIDPDFPENIVEVDRLDHARIHWGYKCDDLEPLFEYITPAQWIIDLIPRGDNRDVGAAVLTAKGEIDEIDMSGENAPMWKGGITYDREAYNKEYNKEYKATPKRKSYEKEYRATPKYKAWQKKYNAEQRLRKKTETGYTMGYSRAKKKTERQGEGTLEAFLK